MSKEIPISYEVPNTPEEDLANWLSGVPQHHPKYELLLDKAESLQAEADSTSSDPEKSVQGFERVIEIEKRMLLRQDNPNPWIDGRWRGAIYADARRELDSITTRMMLVEVASFEPDPRHVGVVKANVSKKLLGFAG